MALVASSIEDPPLSFSRRWNFDEHVRITELFNEAPLRVDPIDGVIVEQLSPQLDQIPSIRLTADAVRTIFGPEFDVNTNLPTRMGNNSAPKPDAIVLLGKPRDFEGRWPEAPEIPLVVEVADSRPDTARRAKIRLYARFGVAENAFSKPAAVGFQKRNHGRKHESTKNRNPSLPSTPTARPS